MDDSITYEWSTTIAPSGSRDASNTIIGHSNVNIVNKGDGNHTHIGHDNRNNRGVVVNIGNTIYPDPRESSETLNELRRAPAYYDSSLRKQAQECMQETRVTILSTIYEWVDSLDKPPIFWLYGLAGTGKSTIAHTVAEQCRRRGRLGASFFFAHSNAECSDPNLFFSTIAYQLSKFVPNLRQHVVDGVRGHPSPQDASIPTQLEEFILTPLRKLSNCPARDPVIVVVDAFDECSDARKASEILQLLSAKMLNFPPLLKIFITSRPEPEIRSILHPDIHLISRSFDLLRDVDACSTEQDIRRFLRFHLGRVGKEYDLPSWPREMDVEALAKQARGLFIFAHTAIELIRDKDVMDPESQLAMLKGIGSSGTPAFNLNALYSRILQKAMPETATTMFQDRVITIIHAIVGLRAPLAMCAIERLLGLDRGAIRTALNRLRSIFIVPDNDEDTVQVIHPSFARYIEDEESCTEKRLFVGHRQLHSQLAKECLKQMKACLKQNICNLKDFTMLEVPIRDEESSDVALRTLSKELKYSCENFASHVFSADWQDSELCEMVAEWANQYLLYWLEVLALIGSFRNALPSLRLLTKFCESQTPKTTRSILRLLQERLKPRTVAPKPSPQLTESSQLLADTIRMVSESYDDIKRFPHLIYTSCLAFSPSDSALFKQSSPLSTVRVLCGKGNNWRPLLHAFKDPDGPVDSLTFSPDGTILASCSSTGKILLWNLETGESRFLACHLLCRKTTFTFSPDGNYIAADGNVYRVATGKEVLIPAKCSAFSPDGLYIALGCANSIITLHDMQSPNLSLFGKLFGHYLVATLAFSSDNKFLAAASSDGTIHVWNCSSWEMIKCISCHDPVWPATVTFSPKGMEACYVTYDSQKGETKPSKYIRAADIQTGKVKVLEVLRNFCHSKGSMTIFSPSGNYIASCEVGALYVARWVAATQESHTLLNCQFGSAITSISFTPDEQSLLVGNEQGLIRSWRIPKDGRSADTFDFECKAHFGAVQAITFSHDAKCFTSASIDGSICVWDSTSVGLYEPDLTHTSLLPGQTATFAPDGQTVAIGSGNTIYKKDAMTGVCIFCTEGALEWGDRLIFSADGKYLSSNSAATQKLFLWDTGNPCTLGKRRTPWGEDLVVAAAFSPDATHYAVRFSNHSLWVYDLLNGESRQIAHHNCERHGEELIFSHDNRHLVSCCWDIWVFDVTKGVATDLPLHARSLHVFGCAFSPCGQHIAIAHEHGLDVLKHFAKIPNIREVHNRRGYNSVAFSPDSKFILAAAGLFETYQLDLFHPDTLARLYTVTICDMDQAMREFRKTGRLLNHPLSQPSEYEDFPYLLDNDGWVITASSKRLCRLPVANHGKVYDVNGNRIVVISPEGKVTLIQFGSNPICIPTPPVESSRNC